MCDFTLFKGDCTVYHRDFHSRFRLNMQFHVKIFLKIIPNGVLGIFTQIFRHIVLMEPLRPSNLAVGMIEIAVEFMAHVNDVDARNLVLIGIDVVIFFPRINAQKFQLVQL